MDKNNEYLEKLVHINRITKVVKAVRRFSNYSGGLIKAKSDNFFCSRVFVCGSQEDTRGD